MFDIRENSRKISRLRREKGASISDLATVAPFMDDGDLDEIAFLHLSRGGNAKDLLPIAPFLNNLSRFFKRSER